jgi:hypothetical protein
MAGGGKVVINLATGLEDAERVTVAFLVGGAAVEQGKTVTMFLTKEAVRLALPGYGTAVACDGCPSLLQRPPARRDSADVERQAWRRHSALAMDRRRTRDGLQLLRGSKRG